MPRLYFRPNRPDLDATKVPTTHDIAWSAGIFEGEGTCRLSGGPKRRTTRGFMIQVVQKDPEILYRLRDWFGGSIRPQGKNGDCSVWAVCGDRGRVFIALCYPYLSNRRRAQVDATEGIAFFSGELTAQTTKDEVQQQLDRIYAEQRSTTWRGNPKVASKRRAELYQLSKGKEKLG